MKRTIVALMMVFMAMSFLTTTGLAAGIGVVNLAFVMDESKAGKQANAALNVFVQERQEALQQMRAHLEQLNAQLEADDQTMSDDERLEKEKELQDALQQYATAVNAFEAEIENALQSLRQRILSEIGSVLQIIGDEGAFDAILDTSSAYYYRHAVDLTSEVIRKYDSMWEAAQTSE